MRSNSMWHSQGHVIQKWQGLSCRPLTPSFFWPSCAPTLQNPVTKGMMCSERRGQRPDFVRSPHGLTNPYLSLTFFLQTATFTVGLLIAFLPRSGCSLRTTPARRRQVLSPCARSGIEPDEPSRGGLPIQLFCSLLLHEPLPASEQHRTEDKCS